MKKKILMVALTFIALQLAAQETNTSWRPTIKVQKALSEKFSLQLAQEAHYFTNLSEWEQFSTTLEGDYSISNSWNAGLAYSWRYNHNIKDDFYASRNRYYLYLKYKLAVGDWNLSIREKFQSTYYNKGLENPSYTPKNVLLTKVEVAYKIKSISLTPYISGQLRYAVNHPTEKEINQYRWALGAQYKINKMLGLDLFFEQRGDMNANNPRRVRIIGTALKVKI